jgi:hypothetical protein
MREFFRGWRRKLGCVTLGLACVVTVFWLRSLATPNESLFFPDKSADPGSFAGIATRPNTLVILKYDSPLAKDLILNGQPLMALTAVISSSCEIPFWSLVIPVVIFSAILLLWPSRRLKPNPGKLAIRPAKEIATIAR